MRTGIKTLYRKIISKIDYPDQFLVNDNLEKFPSLGMPSWKISLKIYSLKNRLRSVSKLPRLNEIHNSPHPLALKVWGDLLFYNPNNIGNWSTPEASNAFGTQKAERTLIRMMVNLYGGNNAEWEGYVTNGGSDSNLYAMWLGRNFLMRNVGIEKICVIQNDLTHYSIPKSAGILNLSVYFSKLNSQTWAFDLGSLEQIIKMLIKKKYKSFILPLTYGYAQTGTNDNYKEINNLMRRLKRIYGIEYYIFVDASLSGLILPFSSRNFYPLKEKDLNLINVDFHKFGMVPFPCGIVLYRSHLRKNIQFRVPFLDNYDSTIGGSRSGVSPAAALMVLLAMGRKGFTRAVEASIKLKENFISLIKKEIPDIDIINDEKGVTVGIVSKRPLPEAFLQRNGLYAKSMIYHFDDGDRRLFVYKATFIKRQ